MVLPNWIRIGLIGFIIIGTIPARTLQADSKQDADEILRTAGFKGGFIAHVGTGDGRLTVALKQSENTQVQGLVKSHTEVLAARKVVAESTQYGEVAVDQFDGFELPYVDNLVNLVVAEDLGDVKQEEVLRVLVPNGVAMIRDASGKWTKTVKPMDSRVPTENFFCQLLDGHVICFGK